MEKKYNLFTLLLLVLFGVAFLAQDWWFISELDDYFYKFVITDSTKNYYEQLDDGKHQMLTSLGEIFSSQWNHYLGSNGRFLVHCVVQICTSLIPLQVFPILNSMFFVLLLYALVKLSDSKEESLNSLFTILALIIGYPVVIAIFMGNIAVSVNYLWSGAIVFAWYYMYENITRKERKYTTIRLCTIGLVSFIAGSMQESFSIGICSGLFFYHLYNWRILTLTKVIMTGLFALGACFCVFAPSNFSRAEGRFGMHMDTIWYLIESYSFVAFILVFLCCCLFSRNKVASLIKDNVVLLIAFITSFIFSFTIAFNGPHQLTMLKILSLLLTLRLIYSFENRFTKMAKSISVFIGFITCIVAYPQMYVLRKNLSKSYYKMEKTAFAHKSQVIVNREYDDALYNARKSYLSPYFFVFPINHAGSLSIYISRGKSRDYIEGIIPVPINQIEEKCGKQKDNAGVTHVYNDTYVYVMEKKVNPEDVHWNYLTSFHNPNKLHEIYAIAQYCIEHNNKYYYIFRVPTQKIVSQSVSVATNQ